MKTYPDLGPRLIYKSPFMRKRNTPYIYIHTRTHVYIYIYLRVCVYACTHTHTDTGTHTHIYMNKKKQEEKLFLADAFRPLRNFIKTMLDLFCCTYTKARMSLVYQGF